MRASYEFTGLLAEHNNVPAWLDDQHDLSLTEDLKIKTVSTALNCFNILYALRHNVITKFGPTRHLHIKKNAS